VRKLPKKAMSSFALDYEDTFAHRSIDALLSTIFPLNDSYILDWANRPADGPKERRGDALKPDSTIQKSHYELAFVELKPPKEDHSPRPYLEVHWKIANFCKD
ncbi:hypothetical protein BGZ46_006774, partial [Entomortierella lignicola]